MRNAIVLVVLLGLAVWGSTALAGEPALKRFEFTQVEMAVAMRIVVYAPDRVQAKRATDAAFRRLHELNGIMSDYDPQSELMRLCAGSKPGNPVAVSDDLWRVLFRAQRVAEQSDGAFDVTVGAMVRLWRRARRRHELPSPERLAEARKLVGYRLVRLIPEGHKVELLKPGMLLDLGGIAKGDACDQALAVLEKEGLHRAMVEAGGDVVLGDPPPGKPGWIVGVCSPTTDSPPARYLALARVAVDTSGDAFQYVEIGGRRYSHIVDPRTGMGLTDGSKVTVIAPNGLTGDPLTKVVAVLGPQRGLKVIEETPGCSVWLLRAPEGKVETFQSSRWKDLPTFSAK
jgi:thiamine biosynthesis lipoprotein